MLLLIPAVVLSLWAQYRVQRAFATYRRVRSESGVTADMVSRKLLDMAGLGSVRIERIHGELTDHYDPRSKVLRLSDAVSGNSSIAAIGVAAHEVGHAVQDKEGYAFLRFRNAIVPAVSIGSQLSMPLFFIGLLFGIPGLLDIGILFFCGVLVFHLVTLPVEFDASARAISMLTGTGFLHGRELTGAKTVLDAAALTYIAALVMTVMQLVRLLALRGRRD